LKETVVIWKALISVVGTLSRILFIVVLLSVMYNQFYRVIKRKSNYSAGWVKKPFYLVPYSKNTAIKNKKLRNVF
jgi:hypothetical protein